MWQLVESVAPGQDAPAVIVVSHGLFYDRLLKSLLDLDPLADDKLFLTANCAYWLVQLDSYNSPDGSNKKRMSLLTSNDVGHVPMSVRTGHSMQGVKYRSKSYE